MSSKAPVHDIFQRRTAGVLLHPTSLPATLLGRKLPCGTLGKPAHYFIHFLTSTGLGVWQMLPTGPTHQDRSPYNACSAHAGNPDLICLESLIEQGWCKAETLESLLSDTLNFTQLANLRENASEDFYHWLHKMASAEQRKAFSQFCEDNHYWLDDFCLFSAIRKNFKNTSWQQWPEAYRRRDANTLHEARKTLEPSIAITRFEQYCFFHQWQSVRQHATDCGITLFGDMPIFVALDSADVWSNQQQFQLDDQGRAVTVAGVPPDYFSATGQHWGNPHYNWQAMGKDGFSWWLARMRTQLAQFDLVRIDHFRGLEAFWEIPAADPDASTGRWVKAPGEALLTALFNEFNNFALIAENLGLITPEVEALRRAFHLPGMYVLQFGFDGNPQNINLPHHYEPLNVVYTGTHDNATSAEWIAALPKNEQLRLADYLGITHNPECWDLIKTALASVARMAIIPLQDWLQLGEAARMNTPGTTGHNWQWQFDWSQVAEDLPGRIQHELTQYDRTGNPIPFH
ncbi:MAG TPA: 4-alpha-glucanotransferase [Cellvibrionaceae bacterium]